MEESKTLERELELLESIYQHRSVIRQRDLAKIVGLSVGMTNSILKRLAQKGWLTIRKVNNRNIHYIVSPEGIDALMRRSYRYFKRTVKNVVLYREAMERLVRRVSREHYSGLVLVGDSDLDFLLEHECMKQDVPLFRTKHIGTDGRLFYLFGEEYRPEHAGTATDKSSNSSYLYELILDRR